MVKKQTTLTLEVFENVLLPKIGTLVDKKINEGFDRFEKHFDRKIDETKEELRSEIKHLPTTEQYYAREDKTMTELKNLRDEVIVTNHLYKKTNKRVDKIDKHLGIDTSVVF